MYLLLEIIIYSIWKMGALLQSGARLCFAPRLQEACALDAFTNIDLASSSHTCVKAQSLTIQMNIVPMSHWLHSKIKPRSHMIINSYLKRHLTGHRFVVILILWQQHWLPCYHSFTRGILSLIHSVPKFDIEHHDPPNVSLNQSTPIPDSNCLMPVVCRQYELGSAI